MSYGKIIQHAVPKAQSTFFIHKGLEHDINCIAMSLLSKSK